jgi:hypothetical protein
MGIAPATCLSHTCESDLQGSGWTLGICHKNALHCIVVACAMHHNMCVVACAMHCNMCVVVAWLAGHDTECMGEDWLSTYRAAASSVDFVSMHIYSRQRPNLPPAFQRCQFECFVNWAVPYIRRHEAQAASLGLPLVIEEFGATTWFE